MKPIPAELRCFSKYESGASVCRFPVTVLSVAGETAVVVMGEKESGTSYEDIYNKGPDIRSENPFRRFGKIPDVGDVFCLDIGYLNINPGDVDGIGE